MKLDNSLLGDSKIHTNLHRIVPNLQKSDNILTTIIGRDNRHSTSTMLRNNTCKRMFWRRFSLRLWRFCLSSKKMLAITHRLLGSPIRKKRRYSRARILGVVKSPRNCTCRLALYTRLKSIRSLWDINSKSSMTEQMQPNLRWKPTEGKVKDTESYEEKQFLLI